TDYVPYLYAWDGDGNPKFSPNSIDSSSHFIVLNDIDGDGKAEIIFGCKDGSVYVYKENVLSWSKSTSGIISSKPAIGDIDGDEMSEIVVTSYGDGVYVWHANGSAVDGWPKDVGELWESSPAVGDLDGDGIDDVVVSSQSGVYAWHGNGSLLWFRTTDPILYSSPVIGDIDGDGSNEVVVGSDYKKVYTFYGNGTPMPGWPQPTGGEVWSTPALCDLNGDGKLEVVVGCKDGKVYAWHYDGTSVSDFPITVTSSWIVSSPAVADIDQDGVLEIVFGSDDGNVYVLDADVVPTTPVIQTLSQAVNADYLLVYLTAESTDINFDCYQLKGGQYADWTDTPETNVTGFNFTLIQNAVNTLEIRGKDSASNVGDGDSVVIIEDSMNPTLIISSSEGTLTHASSTTISGDVNGTGSTPTVTVNGVSVNITFTDTYAGAFSATLPLSVGANTITVTATDAAGNSAASTMTITRLSAGGGSGGSPPVTVVVQITKDVGTVEAGKSKVVSFERAESDATGVLKLEISVVNTVSDVEIDVQ
ncbi:MAG: VCBS repeat-containing protein, partial [Deltaproteobacteria bacterium]|nr:VCBS repeat-containing protein [Deltaproteobacteria bacterium]